MLINPIRSAGRRKVLERYRPAPTRGVNTHDSSREIEGGRFGLVIDNFTCRTDGLTVRPGHEITATRDAGISSLLNYPDQIVARTDGDWIGEVLPNSSGDYYLLAAKGEGLPQVYNGMAWQDATLTSDDTRVDITKIDGIIAHNGRFFGFLVDDFELVYLPTRQFGGELEVYPMHPLFSEGGRILALASMTNDGGEDGRDSLCIVSSEGELVVFDGPDPSFRDRWRLRGVYPVPKPVGRRCFTQLGGGLGLLTERGLLSVPQVLIAHRSRQVSTPLSRNVGPIADARAVLDSESETVTLIDAGEDQWVRDPETRGWSRWRHLDATCWLEGHDGLYFGKADGTVNRMVRGASDGLNANGDAFVPVRTYLADAFTRYGTLTNKSMQSCRLHFEAAHPYQPRVSMMMDYRAIPSVWDANRIDNRHWFWPDVSYAIMPAVWARETSSRLGKWRGVDGEGDAASLLFAGQFLGVEGKFIGYDTLFAAMGGR